MFSIILVASTRQVMIRGRHTVSLFGDCVWVQMNVRSSHFLLFLFMLFQGQHATQRYTEPHKNEAGMCMD